MTRTSPPIARILCLAAAGVVLVCAGGLAAMVFPVLKRLGPHVPAFAAYPGDHWAIVGAAIMIPAFWASAAALASASVVNLAAAFARRSRGKIVLAGLLAGAAGAHVWLVARMAALNNAFLTAAAAGRADDASAARASFQTLHPWSTAAIVAALVLLIAAAAAEWPRGKPS
ncbi:MAG: hypothetical protein IBJ11_05950 [Phycisphaerales bacterium]|nr:hypothetical protein [Phycisphaerales bacterium]